MSSSRKGRKAKALGALALSGALGASLLATANASSHRESPLLQEDPVADNTDVYAFVSPDNPDTVTLAANWIPLQEAANGPDFYNFGDDVRYDINVDNNGDAVDDVTYQFRFRKEITNPDTALYNLGPVTSLDDPDLVLRQYYTVTEVRGGQRTVLGEGQVAPYNIGPRSTPNYEALANSAITQLSDGTKVFAGPRDDPFFIDIGSAFDLLGLRPLNEAHLLKRPAEKGLDGLDGYNVHTIALQVPKHKLVADDPVIATYSTTHRRRSRVLRDGGATLDHRGPWVQVSRLGQPLVNELIVPRPLKNTFNASRPTGDAAFLPLVQDPEPSRLIPVLYPGVTVPPAPRDDIVTIFLTGIPGANQQRNGQPFEAIRLNTSIPPTHEPSRLGVLGGDNQGFPNGRRPADDVVDVELRALAGGTPFTPEFNRAPNNALTDGVDTNDVAFLGSFPYLGLPHQGYDHDHRHGSTP